MKRQGKLGANHEFHGPLWDDQSNYQHQGDAFECLIDQYSEDPRSFAEDWLQPLLAEGLSADGALELLVNGAIRPN
jgi:hypothetical protein